MFRRWFIRSFFLGLLLLFAATVVMWVRGRYVGDDLMVIYNWGGPPWTEVLVQGWSSDGGMRLVVEINHSTDPASRNMGDFMLAPPGRGPFGEHGWFSSYGTYGLFYPFDTFSGVKPHLGFQWTAQDAASGGTWSKERSLTVPAWFPTLLFGGICAFAWHKARAKPSGTRAFPVEMDKLDT